MLALVQESSSSSAGKLIMQTKGLPTLPVNPNFHIKIKTINLQCI